MHLQTRVALLLALAPNLACPMIHITNEQAESGLGTTSEASTTGTSSTSPASGSTSDADGDQSGTSSKTSSASSTGHEVPETGSSSTGGMADDTTGDPVPQCPSVARDEGLPCTPSILNGEWQNTMDCDKDCTTPICGDSIFNPEFGEECDDGEFNDNDGFCTEECERLGLLAFVTSKGDFTGNITAPERLSGTPAANAHCTSAAQTIPEIAAIQQEAIILAWLSTRNDLNSPTSSPLTTFADCDRPYFLPKSNSQSRRIISKNFSDLTSKDLLNPISTTEHGTLALPPENVITATRPNGEATESGDCLDFNYSGYGGMVRHGNLEAVNKDWTSHEPLQFCNVAAHLYCFEQCPPQP